MDELFLLELITDSKITAFKSLIDCLITKNNLLKEFN